MPGIDQSNMLSPSELANAAASDNLMLYSWRATDNNPSLIALSTLREFLKKTLDLTPVSGTYLLDFFQEQAPAITRNDLYWLNSQTLTVYRSENGEWLEMVLDEGKTFFGFLGEASYQIFTIYNGKPLYLAKMPIVGQSGQIALGELDKKQDIVLSSSIEGETTVEGAITALTTKATALMAYMSARVSELNAEIGKRQNNFVPLLENPEDMSKFIPCVGVPNQDGTIRILAPNTNANLAFVQNAGTVFNDISTETTSVSFVFSAEMKQAVRTVKLRGINPIVNEIEMEGVWTTSTQLNVPIPNNTLAYGQWQFDLSLLLDANNKPIMYFDFTQTFELTDPTAIQKVGNLVSMERGDHLVTSGAGGLIFSDGSPLHRYLEMYSAVGNYDLNVFDLTQVAGRPAPYFLFAIGNGSYMFGGTSSTSLGIHSIDSYVIGIDNKTPDNLYASSAVQISQYAALLVGNQSNKFILFDTNNEEGIFVHKRTSNYVNKTLNQYTAAVIGTNVYSLEETGGGVVRTNISAVFENAVLPHQKYSKLSLGTVRKSYNTSVGGKDTIIALYADTTSNVARIRCFTDLLQDDYYYMFGVTAIPASFTQVSASRFAFITNDSRIAVYDIATPNVLELYKQNNLIDGNRMAYKDGKFYIYKTQLSDSITVFDESKMYSKTIIKGSMHQTNQDYGNN